MCLAKLYQEPETEEPILEDIAHARFEEGKIELETLLGESKVFQGKLKEIDFMNSKIIITG